MVGYGTIQLILFNMKTKSVLEYWLVTLRHDRVIALDELGIMLGHTKKGSLRLASNEMLEENLQVKQGSVSPFALLHDCGGAVKFALDSSFAKVSARICRQ